MIPFSERVLLVCAAIGFFFLASFVVAKCRLNFMTEQGIFVFLGVYVCLIITLIVICRDGVGKEEVHSLALVLATLAMLAAIFGAFGWNIQ